MRDGKKPYVKPAVIYWERVELPGGQATPGIKKGKETFKYSH